MQYPPDFQQESQPIVEPYSHVVIKQEPVDDHTTHDTMTLQNQPATGMLFLGYMYYFSP